jgi:SDR family mycofactocin-dependent oxidoreductase
MGRVQGKVALITGAARGQGRSHAVRLAEEGADIIAIDACRDIASVPFPLASEAQLAETAELVEERGGKIVTRVVDVRDLPGLHDAVTEGIAQLGGLDIVVANAGIGSFGRAWELTEQQWQDMLDVNLTGVWKTTVATIPTLIEQGRGGSLILTSSISGLVAEPNLAHYTASKHGVNGLMRTLAVELAPHRIRVNSVCPCTVWTPMIDNDAIYTLFTGGNESATWADVKAASTAHNALPVPWIEPADVSNAVLYLASDETRYVTGTTHVVDAGALAPFKGR